MSILRCFKKRIRKNAVGYETAVLFVNVNLRAMVNLSMQDNRLDFIIPISCPVTFTIGCCEQRLSRRLFHQNKHLDGCTKPHAQHLHKPYLSQVPFVTFGETFPYTICLYLCLAVGNMIGNWLVSGRKYKVTDFNRRQGDRLSGYCLYSIHTLSTLVYGTRRC